MSDKPHLGLVFFPAFDWQISPTHLERKERLLYTRDQLLEEGLLDNPLIREYNPREASWHDIERVHIGAPSLYEWVTPAHRVSAGGTLVAADAVLQGEVDRAFALVRPPGHHAMRMVHGIRGFCTINIEAIMVAHIRQQYGVHKIAVVDTDVHHGDGSEDIFYHDPDTLYISFHQDGRTLYPGTGFPSEFGGPQAIGSNVNIPLPPGTGDEGLHKVLDELVLPMIHDFGAEFIINSAGQDNHFSDPLANMQVTAKGYARLADKLQAQVAVLEGGYSVQAALPYVNTGLVLAMANMDYSHIVEPDYDDSLYRQSTKVTAYIDQMISNWQIQCDKREIMQKEALEKYGRSWKRKRSIYYDESGINETQEEEIPLHLGCLGWHGIHSTSLNSPYGIQKVYTIIIPRQANTRCRQDAYDKIWLAKKNNIANRYVILDGGKDIQEEI